MKNINPYHFLFLLIALSQLGFTQSIRAQDASQKAPIPVEFLIGNNRMFFQMVVKRNFSSESKFGFLSVSSITANYDNEMENLDMAGPVLITYNFYKKFSLVGGATISNRVGYSPLLGAQHSYSNKEWVSVTIASVFLNSTKNIELFGLYEYKPSISPKLNLYNRIQFLYIHNTSENIHARSFLQLRSGMKMNALNFGIGANLDQYGPEKTFKPNYGVFVGWAFQ